MQASRYRTSSADQQSGCEEEKHDYARYNYNKIVFKIMIESICKLKEDGS